MDRFPIDSWVSPTKEYHAKPFWALNGKLNKEELKKQILIMKEMGFGGAFLHSRTGLETEYMGEEWLKLIDYCVDVLEENGMEAYLYDEDRWPSGTCGGYVTQTKEFQAKSMVYEEVVYPYVQPENFLALFAIRFDSEKRVRSFHKISDPTEAKQNEKAYVFYYQYMLSDSFYNGATYLDTLNICATERFLELTHERYKSVMGDKFGKQIVGVFTDEPHRGPLFLGFSRKEKNKMIEMPYSYNVFNEFEKRKGYKIEDNLPILWFGKSDEPFAKEMYDYIDVLNEVFLQSFAKPYHDWCKKNSLIVTGHILHEDNLAAQTLMSGSCMRYYEYLDYPGMDNLSSENYVYTVPAMVSSVAKQLDKGFVLDELYGVSGWHMTLNDYKRIGDWQAFGGVTLRCPHLSWYTMKGEAKRDCPASIFRQSSWYKHYSVLEDYYARLSYLMKNGEDDTQIAIIHPIESTWGISNEHNYCGFFGTNDERYLRLEREYAELYKAFCYCGIQADYIDEGLFAKYGKVDGDNFVCGIKSYKKVVLNGNLVLKSSTFSAIKRFLENGGEVYIVGSYPEYLDGEKYDFTNDLKKAKYLPFDVDKLCKILKDRHIYADENKIIVQRRSFGEDELALFLNPVKESISAKLYIRSPYAPKILDIRHGKIFNVESKFIDGYHVVEKAFAPNEEFAVICAKEVVGENVKVAEEEPNYVLSEFEYELQEDNMLVLDDAKCYVDGELFKQGFVLDIDRAVREKFSLERRHSEMIQPWFKKKFYDNNDKRYCKITLNYTFNIRLLPNILRLMFELSPNTEVCLNDTNVDMSVLSSTEIDNCFSVLELPTSLLKEGKNELNISFDFYESTNIEGAFLLGNFGVDENDNLVSLPKKLNSGDICKQYLPYYGGRIKLYANIDNGEYIVTTPNLNCASAVINGKDMSFSPNRCEIEVLNGKVEIEIAMTRNNCFAVKTENGARVGKRAQGFSVFSFHKIEE